LGFPWQQVHFWSKIFSLLTHQKYPKVPKRHQSEGFLGCLRLGRALHSKLGLLIKSTSRASLDFKAYA
jgi:hypothetical protein